MSSFTCSIFLNALSGCFSRGMRTAISASRKRRTPIRTIRTTWENAGGLHGSQTSGLNKIPPYLSQAGRNINYFKINGVCH